MTRQQALSADERRTIWLKALSYWHSLEWNMSKFQILLIGTIEYPERCIAQAVRLYTWDYRNGPEACSCTCQHRTAPSENDYRDHTKFNPLEKHVQKCLWCRCANASVLSYKRWNMNYEELNFLNSVWEEIVFPKAHRWQVMPSSCLSSRKIFCFISIIFEGGRLSSGVLSASFSFDWSILLYYSLPSVYCAFQDAFKSIFASQFPSFHIFSFLFLFLCKVGGLPCVS